MSDTEPANLRERVANEIRRRWVKLAPADLTYQVAPEKVESVAKTALTTMLVRDFRVTPLPPPDEHAQLLARVLHWVRKSKPIRVRIGYAPMKNACTVDHTSADWAEFFSLCHLGAWHNKVQAVYPPGLEIRIIFDDSTVRMANQYDTAPMEDYMQSIGRLIKTLGYESLIVNTIRQSSFSWIFKFGFFQWANFRVKRWERDPTNKPVMDRMLEFARRNLTMADDLPEAEKDRRYEAAAHRYRVYWEALQISGFSRLGKGLNAMYLDGHQHHLRQEAALHLASLGKQQLTQPWQGPGALLDNGTGKLVPIVLTAKRLARVDCETISLGDLVPSPDFASIQVARERVEQPTVTA
ncbi:MAG TPA: hypothetical protein VH107_04180 [Lacipirellulaceae bacterium]|jgi:hypothetical protein|nr:hypothetical protein [Lacipirellulaceae bacterium]